MPKLKKKESEEWKEGSVYDFLYQDTSRIGLFLAQMEGIGEPREHTKSETVSASDTEEETKQLSFKGTAEGSVKAGAGIAGVEGSVRGNVDASEGEGSSSGETRGSSNTVVYDPKAINTLKLLKHLRDRSMIQCDVTKARVGQIISVRGMLSYVDYSPFDKLLQLEYWKKTFLEAMGRHYDENSKKYPFPPSKPTFISAMTETALTLKSFSGFLLAAGDGVGLFGVADKSSFTSPPEHLRLVHRSPALGNWAMIGTLDGERRRKNRPHVYLDNPITALVNRYYDTADTAFGVHEASYIVTPLMIFREVKPASSNSDSGTAGKE